MVVHKLLLIVALGDGEEELVWERSLSLYPHHRSSLSVAVNKRKLINSNEKDGIIVDLSAMGALENIMTLYPPLYLIKENIVASSFSPVESRLAKMPDRSVEYHPQTPQQYYAQLEEDNSAMMPVIY